MSEARSPWTDLVPTREQEDDSWEETSFDDPEHESKGDETGQVVNPLGTDRHASLREAQGTLAHLGEGNVFQGRQGRDSPR